MLSVKTRRDCLQQMSAGRMQAGFEWRMRGGQFVRPDAMATRHLFMTLVTIWNATCPEGLEIPKSGSWNHHMYEFGPFYSVDYLKSAVVCLAVELSKRDDLEDCWWDTLDKIIERSTRRRIDGML